MAGARPREAGARRRNHALWFGPLVACGGFVSYFLVFARWPVLRDFPWLNLPLVLAGLAVSIVAFRRRDPLASRFFKVLAWAGAGFSGLVAALFCAYVFVLSSMVPAPTALTQQLELAPDFALQDQHGAIVRLSDLRGKNVILTFFRGFW
jgi:hypothetical protein